MEDFSGEQSYRKEGEAGCNKCVGWEKMHAMRNVQRKERKFMWNEGQGRNQGVINEKRSDSDIEGKRERNDKTFLRRRSTEKATRN